MKSTWPLCFAETLKHEGGFVNHPRDPGGMTNLGVTKRVWETYVGKSVGESEMRALTPALVQPLYKRNYWDKVSCDDLPTGLDFAVYDYAVNSGTSRSAKTLQRLLGVSPDGDVGPQTLRAVRDKLEYCNARDLIEDYCDSRLSFLKSLSTWDTFGKGWDRRVREVREFALKLTVK